MSDPGQTWQLESVHKNWGQKVTGKSVQDLLGGEAGYGPNLCLQIDQIEQNSKEN